MLIRFLIALQVFLITGCSGTDEKVNAADSNSVNKSTLAAKETNVLANPKVEMPDTAASKSDLNNLTITDQDTKLKPNSKNITRVAVSTGNATVSPPYQMLYHLDITESELYLKFRCGSRNSEYDKLAKLSNKLKNILTSSTIENEMIRGEGNLVMNAADWDELLKIVKSKKLFNQKEKTPLNGAPSTSLTLYAGDDIIYSGSVGTSSLSENASSILQQVLSWGNEFIEKYEVK